MATSVDMPRRIRPHGAWRRPGAALAVLLLALAGCASETNDRNDNGAVTRTVESRGCRLTLTLSSERPTSGEPVEVRIEVEAPRGSQVSISDYADLIGESERGFEMRPFNRRDARPAADDASPSGTWRQSLSLEFVLPGEFALPPARATVTLPAEQAEKTPGGDAADGRDPRLVDLETEGVTVEALDPSARELSPEELADIKVLDPVELRRPWQRYLPYGIAAAALLAYLLFHRPIHRLLGRLLNRVTHPPKPAPPPLPADVWAKRELASLIASNLLDRGQIKEFHYRVSFIVRGYIERRYGVHAGEMTTEEFLEAAVADRRFGEEITGELRRFMDACDLVKYAGQEAGRDESLAAVDAAEQFVERTMPAEGIGPAEGIEPAERAS